MPDKINSLKIIIKQNGSCGGIHCLDCYFNEFCKASSNEPTTFTFETRLETRLKISKKMVREEKLKRICQTK